MQSIWEKTTNLPRFARLERDLKTDVLIIGGGLAGLLCAHRLAAAGADYALVEAGRLCGGVTQNTTAKITSQHGLIYHRLVDSFGIEKARLYLAANQAALAEYRRLAQDIDCGFALRDAFVYSRRGRRCLQQELDALGRLGFPAAYAPRLPLPFDTDGAVRFPQQAQFDPLRFAAAIAQGLVIYENTPVRELAPHTAVTDHGRITARKIIVATHFPILNKHGGYFLKLYQQRAYLLALADVPDPGGMYVDEAAGGFSFSSHQGVLLLGGGSHRTGKPGAGWRGLEALAAEAYPDAREVGRWATQDCMSLDDVPYIGRYAGRIPDLYVATGFNKWGMSSAMVAAMVLGDMVTGRENPWAPVFSPARRMLRPQLAKNALEAAASLLSPAPRRCPHMGCALRWNPEEHSWDCPCHGSRFTREGHLLENPATGDLKR